MMLCDECALSLRGVAVGSRGIGPVVEFKARVRQDFGTWKRFVWFPSLLWIWASDFALRFWVALGTASSVLLMFGGPWSRFYLFWCWLTYISFDSLAGPNANGLW